MPKNKKVRGELLMIHTKKTADAEKKPAISYYTKQPAVCPFCKKEFPHEEMLSGSGRMIAGELTDELHRVFEPSARYGVIYPLIYAVGACPHCHAALLWSDFPAAPDQASVDAVLNDGDARKKAVSVIFPHYDLSRPRTLYDGAAMYYLALLTYEQVSRGYSPTIKKAIVSLRLAWLSMDVHGVCPNHNFDYIAQVFYRKALFFYQQSLIYEMDRTESITAISNFGPDIDKNYGYDGVIYLNGLLEFKYGQREDIRQRLTKLDECKRSIARIFGLGKSSKAKPGPLLEHSRHLYDSLAKELKEANIIEFDDDDE